MKKKHIYIPLFAVVVPVVFAACTSGMGMGEEVDMQNPSISTYKPLNNAYVKSEFEIAGVWDDNVAVTRIVVSVTGKSGAAAGAPLLEFDNAKIDAVKKTWKMTIAINKEGAFLITAVAYDAAMNKMSDIITVTVDNSPPVVEKSYITRYDGAPPVILKEDASALETMPKNYANIDYFQNERFTVNVYLKESYGMRRSALELYEAVNGSLGETPVYRQEYEGQSIFSPTWRIDADALPGSGGGGGCPP
ncbi:MAG: hypothetical protein LBB48_08925 [Treponema sp.]|nr:hypothetical protein [Treponema sp.]